MAKVWANRQVKIRSPISSTFKTKLTLFKKSSSRQYCYSIELLLPLCSVQSPFSDCMNYLLKR